MEENEKQQRQQPQKLTHLLFIIISNCDYRLSQFLLLVSANCSLSFFAEPSSSRPHRPHLSSSIIKKKLTKTHSPFVGSADPKTRKPVNSKITYLFVFVFLTPLSVTSRQLPSKNKNFKNFKNPYPDCVLPPFYRLKPFESDGTMCGVNGRDTENQPPQGFTPQKPQSLSVRRKKKKIKTNSREQQKTASRKLPV